MTNYNQDVVLREIATTKANLESGIAQHYETLRFHIVNGVFLICGAILAYYFGKPPSKSLFNAIPFVFLSIGIVGFVISRRLTQAHCYHYMHYLKARQILDRGHPKMRAKSNQVEKYYESYPRFWRIIDHDAMWDVTVLVVPVACAIITFLAW